MISMGLLQTERMLSHGDAHNPAGVQRNEITSGHANPACQFPDSGLRDLTADAECWPSRRIRRRSPASLAGTRSSIGPL